MQTSTDAIYLTIIISTVVALSLSFAIIYFLFLYQRKRFRHQQELIEIRQAFGQTLLQSKLDIQEQTLDHIAKELHANFSHLVSLININLSEVLPQVADDQRGNIVETKSLAKQLMSELKALSASLNTDHINHIGFVKALENELNRLAQTGKYDEVKIVKTGETYRMPPEHEIILFRLCQEVLNNVVKYAKASRIVASLTFTPDQFSLTITDNGCGFDVQEALSRSGEKQSTGLLNIRKRASYINAEFNINSRIGEGTKVLINIPHPEKTKSPAI
ncbi:sensor histidine kinase [Chitinophaga japonensis]|uniref:histidine kinase n=1 Tax=Chitinophaga japonensis TaxID=104662 RepID=A0A562T3C1_CHIJA|nr:ATP-binding protein [Chitinophaga japonensis]TWI88071.1 signal transduction histidine kinase [Chitinophaga japonensis]